MYKNEETQIQKLLVLLRNLKSQSSLDVLNRLINHIRSQSPNLNEDKIRHELMELHDCISKEVFVEKKQLKSKLLRHFLVKMERMDDDATFDDLKSCLTKNNIDTNIFDNLYPDWNISDHKNI